MTKLLRRPHTNTRPAFGAARRSPLCAILLLVASLALLVLAAPAGAVISGNFGFQRREAATVVAAPLQYHGGPVLHSSNAYAIYWDPTGSYRGDWKRLINKYFQNVGAQSGSLENVFALNGQYGDAGGGAADRSTFRGGYTATDPYPTSENCTDAATVTCLTDQQIKAELQHVIASGVLPGASGPAVYYLLTPPGVTVCTDGGGSGNCSDASGGPSTGICGYHSAISPGGPSPVVYAVQPWVAGDSGLIVETKSPLVTSLPTDDVFPCQDNSGTLQEPNQEAGLNPFGNYGEGLADLIINDLSIEQSNIVVDPLLNGWYQTATHAEQADMCQWDFGPPPASPSTPAVGTNAGSLTNESIGQGSYYLQWAFDSSWVTAGKGFSCWAGDSLDPHFTAPNPVNSGDVVGFDANESLITLQAAQKGLPADEPYVAPVYTWSFGDGTGASGVNAASQFHSYQYGGTYDVTLTVTDSGRNSAQFSEPITVVGPRRPEAASTSSSSSSSSSVSPSPAVSSPTPPAGASAPPHANPVATQAVISRSIAAVASGGLVVRYSVNEQVAGRFEVLLASSVARRLGLTGALAGGLAVGTPPQTMIAKAVLVTTKGGRSTFKIQLSKANASHLRRAKNLSLMVRLVVRNATSGSTTVLNTAKLRR